ncbi:MAG: hypothetical protein ACTTKZ_06055 [Bacteroides sp.]
MYDYKKDRDGESTIYYLHKALHKFSPHDLKWFPADFTLETNLANNKGLELVIDVKDRKSVTVVLSKE